MGGINKIYKKPSLPHVQLKSNSDLRSHQPISRELPEEESKEEQRSPHRLRQLKQEHNSLSKKRYKTSMNFDTIKESTQMKKELTKEDLIKQ